jgi:hypothetical protein
MTIFSDGVAGIQSLLPRGLSPLETWVAFEPKRKTPFPIPN